MFVPGFASSRVPVRVRLFLAIILSILILPLVAHSTSELTLNQVPIGLLALIAAEVAVGATIGLMVRMFFVALEFAAQSIEVMISLSAAPGLVVDGTQPIPPLSTLVMLAATLLLFVTDLHLEILAALIRSYTVMPASNEFLRAFDLASLVKVASETFFLALQIASPFVVFSVTFNLLFGLLNKLIPQIAVYFVSMPIVIFVGFLLLDRTLTNGLLVFIDQLTGWLTRGL